MQSVRHREHRSGLKVITSVQYRAPRRGLIGYSYEQEQAMRTAAYEAGINVVRTREVLYLWKLQSREEIVNKLNVLCPGHGFTKDSLKIPMLILWMQNEDIKKNPVVIRKARSYSGKRLTHCPPPITRKEREKRKRKRRNKGRSRWPEKEFNCCDVYILLTFSKKKKFSLLSIL